MSSHGVRTRAQREAALAAGNPPTPPQSLPMSTTRATRVPRLKKLPKKDEDSSRETAKSSLPPVDDAPKLRRPFFSQDLSLVHIWLEPTNSLLKSKALYPQGEASIKIAVPLETVQDFLSTLQPAYKPSTIPVVAYTVLQETAPRKSRINTNLSRSMKAKKRKLAETDASSESPSKRAKTIEVEPVVPAMPAVAFEGPPATVMRPKPLVRVPLGHKAYDRKGNCILMPYQDQIDDLVMPEEAMRMLTGKKSLMRMMAEHKTKQEEKKAALAAKEQETLTAGASLENGNASEAPNGGLSAPTATEGVNTTEGVNPTEGVNTSQAQGQSEPATGSGTQMSSDHEAQQPHNLQTQTQTPSRGGFLGNLMGSVRRLVPGLHRSPLGSILPGATNQVGTLHAAEASQTNVLNASANSNSTLANDTTSNKAATFTHRALSSNSTVTQASSNGDSLKVPKPTLVSREAHQKAMSKQQRKMMLKQKAKKARENTIQDEVARRVKEQLAALTGSKRKRFSPDRIPNPVGTSYGLDSQFFASDSESDEEVEEISNDSPSIRPAKRQRPNDEVPYTPTRQIFGDPHRATPYTGTMFADPPDPNLFSWRKRKPSFAVPESSSDEHSDGVDTTTKVSKNKGKGKEVQFSDKLDFSDQPSNRAANNAFHASLLSEPLKSAMKATNRPTVSWQQAPPPSPKPSHAALATAIPTATSTATVNATPIATHTALFAVTATAAPTVIPTATSTATLTATVDDTPIATPTALFAVTATATPDLPMPYLTGNTDALARVRSQALRYTPVVPSGLRAASRLSSSSIGTPVDVGTYDDTYDHIDDYTYDQTDDQTDDQSYAHTYEPTIDDTYDPSGAYDISQYRTLKADQVHIVNGQLRPVPGCIPAREEPEMMDQEVRAAVDAIREDDLAEFGFPANKYSEIDMDPAVKAALDAVWDVEDENRAECIFNETLADWIDENMRAPLPA
ncbi:hypothetical protein MMC32_000722 [Xylographa parallela]|nr:hypothetical protein [Xylographa parallela]